MIFDINIIGDSGVFFIHKYVVLILIPISISKLLSESLAPTSRFVPQPRKKHESYVNIFCNICKMLLSQPESTTKEIQVSINQSRNDQFRVNLKRRK